MCITYILQLFQFFVMYMNFSEMLKNAFKAPCRRHRTLCRRHLQAGVLFRASAPDSGFSARIIKPSHREGQFF